LSTSRLVTAAQIQGRVRGAGSEFVLACDMRFAARESAIFSQPEQGFGLIRGAGGIQHLTRLLGRARALEVMLSADDYDAELAERYGWINRALPGARLGEFVRSLADRIAGRRPRRGQGSGQCDLTSAGPTISAAIRISSWSARAIRRRSAGWGSRSRAASYSRG
jgi:enoyl-CoA hydratase/carnithine racemase